MTLEQWEKRTERPLLVASVLFMALLCVPVLQPRLSRTAHAALTVADVVLWAVFAGAYVVGLRLAQDRRRYVRTHLLDLAVVVLPAFRPLRLLRLLTLGGLLNRRGSRAVAFADVTRAVASVAVVLTLLGAVAELDAERGAPRSNIQSFGDALWWAASTMANGGGDHYPVTVRGRVVAVGIQLVGVMLLGLFTAGIASSFVRRFSREPEIEAGIRVEAAELAEVRDRLAAIEAALTRLAVERQ